MPSVQWYKRAIELGKLSTREFKKWMEKNGRYYVYGEGAGGDDGADNQSLFRDEYRRRRMKRPSWL